MVIVDNTDKMTDLFNDRTIQLCLDSTMKITTEGTGAVKSTARTIVGVDHYNTNLSDYKNVLTQFHRMNLNQVRTFSGWFTGEESSSLVTSLDMKIKAMKKCIWEPRNYQQIQDPYFSTERGRPIHLQKPFE